jgi:hypothetical protein
MAKVLLLNPPANGRPVLRDFAYVSVQANAFAAMTAEELRGMLRWAVTSFYLRPAQVYRLLRCTPWSTLARQGTSVLSGMFEVRA